MEPNKPADAGAPRPLGLLWAALAAILLAALLQTLSGPRTDDLGYGAWWRAVGEGRVASARVSAKEIVGAYRPRPEDLAASQRTAGGVQTSAPGTVATGTATLLVPYRVDRGGIADGELRAHCLAHDVELSGGSSSVFFELAVVWLGGFVILIVFWLLMMRRLGSVGSEGALAFGRSKAKLSVETDVRTTFADVAGADEAVEEVKEIVDLLKRPERFRRLGAEIPRGALIVGLPGTGKTLLARALAGEAKVPFLHLSGSDFVEMFAGMGAARVRDLFRTAKEKAPCIVFVDEIDALGKSRSAVSVTGNDEREQTLNALLVEMDGFEKSSGVVVVAATNRPDTLDRALLRPGRFDRTIVVDRPDQQGRLAILKVHARGKRLAEDVELDTVARRTIGLVGADLANLLNEAALLAGRGEASVIGMRHIEEALDRIMAGLEKKRRIMTAEERRIVAIHESGHAILAEVLPGADRVHKVSIVPRGVAALGFTLQMPKEDRYLERRQSLLDRLCVLLGGRAAEEVVFGDVTTGAQSDLERATDLTRRMVLELGMSRRLGLASYADKARADGLGLERRYAEETAREADLETKSLLDEQYGRAKDVLLSHREALERLASRLLTDEVVDRAELTRILEESAPVDAARTTQRL